MNLDYIDNEDSLHVFYDVTKFLFLRNRSSFLNILLNKYYNEKDLDEEYVNYFINKIMKVDVSDNFLVDFLLEFLNKHPRSSLSFYSKKIFKLIDTENLNKVSHMYISETEQKFNNILKLEDIDEKQIRSTELLEKIIESILYIVNDEIILNIFTSSFNNILEKFSNTIDRNVIKKLILDTVNKNLDNDIISGINGIFNLGDIDILIDEKDLIPIFDKAYKGNIINNTDTVFYKILLNDLLEVNKNLYLERNYYIDNFNKYVYNKLDKESLSKFKLRASYLDVKYLERLQIDYNFDTYKKKFILNRILDKGGN